MPPFVGTPVRRKEDPALLAGRGSYADDLPTPAGTLHAHVIHSPHPHADAVASRDGRRVYFTNSLYGAIDPQFYPDGIDGWMVKLDSMQNACLRFRERVHRP